MASSEQLAGDRVKGASARYTVTGTVSSPDSAAVGGLTVTLVDKNVAAADVVLGTADTRPTGEYAVTVQIPHGQLAERHKERPDLQVVVSHDKVVLGRSIVRWNAAEDEELDVVLPAGLTTLPSEYETLTAAIGVHYRGSLAELKEDGDRQDITYLANKIGWDARAVAMATVAHGLAADHARLLVADRIELPAKENLSAHRDGIHPAFYYALLRAGAPADPVELHRISPARVRETWEQAIDRGTVPTALREQLEPALGHFVAVASRQALQAPMAGSGLPLDEVLTPVLGDDRERKQAFADAYTRHADDPERMWAAVEQEMGSELTERLKFAGQLAYLTLNNAPLLERLLTTKSDAPITTAADLATHGFYDSSAWQRMLGDSPVPAAIPGDSADEKRRTYADLLATQVRTSFPTATVAGLVRSRVIDLGEHGNEALRFLDAHQEQFDIGAETVRGYLARTGTELGRDAVVALERVQRVYQITPTSEAMATLLGAGLDSAFAVTRLGQDRFVEQYSTSLGSDTARSIYARAETVHASVLNVVVSYANARKAPGLGLGSLPSLIGGLGGAPPATPAQATLDDLFQQLDYCECEDCRSIIGPAAYLVDLLHYLDNEPRTKHDNPPTGFRNPLEVLQGRRPDIGYLPLTCENTNTALPYLDLVNETLEFYVGNGLSMTGYRGHDTDDTTTTAELVASPQNDDDDMANAAYTALRAAMFPPPLPFHRDLELLRGQLAALSAPLSDLMRVVRTGESYSCPPPAAAGEYGWCDILAERLGISRLEYRLLTDSTVTVQELYGYGPGENVVERMSTLQEFSRRVGISYEDVVQLLQTRFVNPNSVLVPLTRALGVSAQTLHDVHTGAVSAAQFADMVAVSEDDLGQYGPQCHALTDLAAWVTTNYAAIMRLIVIDVAGAPDDTTAMTLQHLDPDPAAQPLTEIEFVRLMRFVRLWKRLGLDIEQTDELICTLIDPTLETVADDAAQLDAALRTMLARAGLAYRALDLLGLDPATDLPAALPCWGPIGANGTDSLYAQLFLSPTLRRDPADPHRDDFAADDNGRVPRGGSTLFANADAICAALNLTRDEFDLLTGTSTAPVAGLGLHYDATTPLTLDTLSAVYRHAWLARQLQLSVLELLALAALTGIDPFAAPVLDATSPVSAPMLDFVGLVQLLQSVGMTPTQALYLLWNIDLSSVSTPGPTVVSALATALRNASAAVDSQFAVTPSATLDLARPLMALVLGQAATNTYFGLLTQTYATSVPFGFGDPALPEAVLTAAAGRLTYDDLAKELRFAGAFDPAMLAAVQAEAGAYPDLLAAVNELADAVAESLTEFFAAYDDATLNLRTLFEAFTQSADPAVRGNVQLLLSGLLPALAQRRKQQQAVAAITAAAGSDATLAPTLLFDPEVLSSTADPAKPAVDDLVAVGAGGLAAEFFAGNDPSAAPDVTVPLVPDLTYATTPLRPGGVGGTAPFAGRWTGYVVAPQTGAVNLTVLADPGAVIEVRIGDAPVLGTTNTAGVWRNTSEVVLTANQLTNVVITARSLLTTFRVTWQSQGTAAQPVPAAALFTPSVVDHLTTTYLRFLKASALAGDLSVAAGDLAFLAADPSLAVGGAGWLLNLAVRAPADAADYAGLTALLRRLLTYSVLRAKYAPKGSQFLDALVALRTGDSTQLVAVTGWSAESLATLTDRMFGGVALATVPDQLVALARLDAAFELIDTSGLPAATLVDAATNDPPPSAVAALQAALRSRLDESDWLSTVMPINDDLRKKQRDALVAYVLVTKGTEILDELGVGTSVNRLPTADDLFNYFLMDVEMEPCMETSRIRHALSSVQLFVERCLRNLEPRVDPGDIAADEWTWRKRYRVWQANREVFLWPENWLEPSLRDDPSPIFTATLSQLMQGDATEDAAVSAYLDYLSNLELVAKLEPCGLCVEPPATPGGLSPVHVVARTAGAHRKHFYRRFDGVSWTPWAEIKLQIEDNPVQPYVWNGRLMLFWLQLHKRAAVTPSSARSGLPAKSNTSLANLSSSDVAGSMSSAAQQNAAQQTSAVLCFSEYYNGTWQPTKTSDVNTPLDLDSGSDGFDRRNLVIRTWQEGGITSGPPTDDNADETLYVQVTTADTPPRPLWWVMSQAGVTNWRFVSGWVLHNTHSAPVRWCDVAAHKLPDPAKMRRLEPEVAANPGQSSFTLSAKYSTHEQLGYTTKADVDVLTGDYPLTLRPPSGDVDSQWNQPFFFEDVRNTFYVTTQVEIQSFAKTPSFGVGGSGSGGKVKIKIPNLVVAVGPVQPGDPVEFTPSLGDPEAARAAFAGSAGRVAVLGTADALAFGGTSLGALGQVPATDVRTEGVR